MSATQKSKPDRDMAAQRLVRRLAVPLALLVALAAAATALSTLLAVDPLIQQALGLGVLVGMIVLMLMFRNGPRQFATTGNIFQALADLTPDRICPEELALSDESTPQARGWNLLMHQLEALRRQRTVEDANGQMNRRSGGRSDLEGICDAISEGLLLVSDRAKIKYANGAAGVYLNAERNALVGSELSEFVKETAIVEAVQAIIAGRGSPRMGIEVTNAENGGVLRFGVRPVRREDSAAAMIIIEDVTQQRVADDARNHFLAQATHELRAPLTNIRLYVETAIDEGEQDAALRGKCLNVINEETRRLERVVNDILSVSEIEAGSFDVRHDDMPLATMLQELQKHYEAQAEEKQLTLTFDLPPKLPVLVGDRDKIMMALHNLLSNALKYTPAGGTITVKAEAESGLLHVDVSDTGIGMAEADAARVFEKFYRAKDDRIATITGSGLGLSLAREVVRLHGGDIALKTTLNQGSTFSLTLPCPPEAA